MSGCDSQGTTGHEPPSRGRAPAAASRFAARATRAAALIVLLAVVTAAGDRGAIRARPPVRVVPNPGTATLPRFALFGWVAPPVGFTTPERYAEMAGAGFNLTVLAWEDPGTVAENHLRLACSGPVGIRLRTATTRLLCRSPSATIVATRWSTAIARTGSRSSRW